MHIYAVKKQNFNKNILKIFVKFNVAEIIDQFNYRSYRTILHYQETIKFNFIFVKNLKSLIKYIILKCFNLIIFIHKNQIIVLTFAD